MSSSDPRRTHADDEDKKPYTEGLPWPWEVQHDAKGRAYYLNHEDKTSSWLNPAKLELFKTHGTLEGNIYEGCGEGAYCVVEEKTVGGESYWVNYTVGEVGGPDRQEDPPAPGA
ncbi:hypothetical protein PspLS_03351 [Pyricularia sp. CBS 133598]|nr:hypothetical protein PspLS_03351 [Pyricularia sp. CBS 133598]